MSGGSLKWSQKSSPGSKNSTHADTRQRFRTSNDSDKQATSCDSRHHEHSATVYSNFDSTWTGSAWRVTYFYAPDRLIVLLTIFRKQRPNERAEVQRARWAMTRCITEQHTAEEGDPMTRTSLHDLKAHKLAAMTNEERAAFDETHNATRLALDVGEKIRDAREAAGFSQRDLASRMGTSQAAVARLEAGGTGATLTTLQKVAAHTAAATHRIGRYTAEPC